MQNITGQLGVFQTAVTFGRKLAKSSTTQQKQPVTANPKTFAPLKPQHFYPPVRFGGIIHNDYSLELRQQPVNAENVAKVLRQMLIRDLVKGDDTSSLKFYLGAVHSDRYIHTDQAALADTMMFIDRPVDVIIKSGAAVDSLKTVLSATGKRFMYAGATMMMGPLENRAPYNKNKDSQIRRELFNEYVRDMETLVMLKTGETDRTKVNKDLMSAKDYNALDALAYGKKGLIDGILMGYDQVITRKDLEKYYKENKLNTPEKIAEFNKNYLNIYKLPTRPLKSFSPKSMPSGNLNQYKSLKPEEKDKNLEPAIPEEGQEPLTVSIEDKNGKTVALVNIENVEDEKDTETKKNTKKDNTKLAIYMQTPNGTQQVDKVPLNGVVNPGPAPERIMLENVPAKHRSILQNDVIFFNDGFNDKTAQQIAQALLELDDKKTQNNDPNHIIILENSPGGSVWSGQELRSTIRSLKTPVDVIVQGMGASCGSWLLSSATGNRLATPQARVMIHEAANQVGTNPGNIFNEIQDGLDQATRDYVGIVADATGRPFKEVWEDFKLDVWFDPLESLFYGKKGLIDGILVGPDKVITRKDVEEYLVDKLGSKDAVNKYVKQKLDKLREPNMEWKPERHNENDPFDNPLRTIYEVAAQKAKPLSELKRFKHTAPSTEERRTIDFYNVVLSPEDDD